MVENKCWICEKETFGLIGKKNYCKKHFYEIVKKLKKPSK